MIIKDDSPLRRIPTVLAREQVLFIDGIRYGISMADYAYARLCMAVDRITQHFISGEQSGKAVPNADAEINCAMNDAWSMVDSIHRLRELLSGMPNLKQKAVELRLFRKATNECLSLRNAVQHLRHEIRALVKMDQPVWGEITWVALESPQAEIFRCFFIYAGTVYHNFAGPAFQPFGKPVRCPVDHISLNAHGISVSLTDCHESLQQVTTFLEQLVAQTLQEQLGKDAPINAADIIGAIEFRKGPPKSDNLS